MRPGGKKVCAGCRQGADLLYRNEMYGGVLLARIMHESPATIADLAVLPGVLGAQTFRRTDKYASDSSPCGCPVARPFPRSRYGVSCIMRARGRRWRLFCRSETYLRSASR
jgi:hypothetical protein